MLARGGVEDAAQLRMHGDRQFKAGFVFGFLADPI
jgi:hypothetical protein